MSIRVRLLLSYIAMLLIPLILLTVAVVFIMVSLIGDIKGLYKLDVREGNPFTTIIQKQKDILNDIEQQAMKNPESLTDPDFLQIWNPQLQDINMGMVVQKNDDIIYTSPNIGNSDYVKGIAAHYSTRMKGDNFVEPFFISDIYEFKYSDHSDGSVFVITDASPLGRFAGKYLTTLIVMLLIVLVITNGLLTYFVSRSIVRPLKALQKATEQIKEGNLDYAVLSQSKDEIGDLFRSFEEMRGRLKQSVHVQLQYEENRKELISNISHDLKTPITNIKGYVEGIMDGVADTPEKLDKYVKTIYAKATDMDRLIDELFLFSKLDLHNVPFHFEHTDIYSFLEDCVEEVRFDLDKQHITLELSPTVNTPMYTAIDREKLKRVLLNILENSAKYMDKSEGFITIRLIDQTDWILIQVEDNGQGVAEDALSSIFERFYRTEQSRNTATGGSGLGLAIAKQIIEGHGGEIRATSQLGEGTSIFFTLKKAQHASKESEI
jgi:signal transduction histidine kinase